MNPLSLLVGLGVKVTTLLRVKLTNACVGGGKRNKIVQFPSGLLPSPLLLPHWFICCRSWSYEIYCSHLRAMPLAGCNISHNADCLSNYLLTSCSLSLTTLQLMLECQRESVSGIVIMIIVNIESIHQYCKTLSIS